MQTTETRPPRTASHPTGLQTIFYPEEHEYILNGEKLTSVTTLIRKWFPTFDRETTAKNKAEREGGCHEQLMAEWDRKRDEAALFGTKVHLMAEKIIQEKDQHAADSLATSLREKAYLTVVKEVIDRIGRSYEFVDLEKIVFSPSKKAAGTIDLLLRNKTTGEFVIADWKTNREIKREAYRHEMGSGPCKNLEHCSFNHYSLQASCYGQLLTGEGYLSPVDNANVRGVLLHLSEKNGRVICDYIKTNDLSKEARLILELGRESA
jgi:ATP-dependent exoDNAse (exonuclease V) beta subunit